MTKEKSRKQTGMYFPERTTVAVGMKKLIKRDGRKATGEFLSPRMVQCASELNGKGFVGWQMMVPKKGLLDMTVFGTEEFEKSDLEWMAEHTAVTGRKKTEASEKECLKLPEIYELSFYSVRRKDREIGFHSTTNEEDSEKDRDPQWPVSCRLQFDELIRALKETGAAFRAVIGGATIEEQEQCRKLVVKTWSGNPGLIEEYTGKPVKARFLMRLPSAPSIRLRTILREAVPGIRIHCLGKAEDREARRIWEDPLAGANVIPDYAARLMLLEPFAEEVVPGIEVAQKPVREFPAGHSDPKGQRSVELGTAINTAGTCKKIKIGEQDLRRHYQIVGQTGTGKSTLLSNIILSAIREGFGLTFFDPHGTTVDTVLRAVPPEMAGKIRVVRIGDAENPVPLNIWDSDDPEKEERNISDLCELFTDIFDPRREGIVGPRYERWLSTFAKASIALLGRRASLESISVISGCQDNMRLVSRAIKSGYPDLAEQIMREYASDRSSDFTNILNWYLCKFQRLTSVEQLRKTLGAGANALDFDRQLDTDTVTLIDLASPLIGTQAARIIGTLMMMKLWNAAMKRKDRSKTHLVVVDEAALFQTNPMPRMLAESRKFGLSLIMCHQHTGQLSADVREALEANAASLSAFRLSASDAKEAALRLNDTGLVTDLAGQNAFRAITAISMNGKQTDPFTLKIGRPAAQKNGEKIAMDIEEQSIRTLVTPYRELRALTPEEIMKEMKDPTILSRKGSPDKVSEKEKEDSLGLKPLTELVEDTQPEWLATWNRRATQKRAG